MNIVTTLPLDFGNVTLACLVIAFVYALATLALEGGIRFIKFAIAADDENAPEIKIGNFLLVALLSLKRFFLRRKPATYRVDDIEDT